MFVLHLDRVAGSFRCHRRGFTNQLRRSRARRTIRRSRRRSASRRPAGCTRSGSSASSSRCLLLFTPSSKSTTTSLTYHRLEDEGRRRPGADRESSIQSGKVTGELTDKTHYASRIPTALNDNTLAAELDAAQGHDQRDDDLDELLERHRRTLAAAAPRRRVLLDQPARDPSARGRDHGDRRVEGEGLRPAAADDALRRRRRLRRREARDQRGRRLLEEPRALRAPRARSRRVAC